jgi:hypothetical protein
MTDQEMRSHLAEYARERFGDWQYVTLVMRPGEGLPQESLVVLNEGAPAPSAERDAAPSANPRIEGEWPDAMQQFLDLFFPQCEDAALVIEPGYDMPPVAIPIAGAIPSCIDCVSWLRFSGHYAARGC